MAECVGVIFIRLLLLLFTTRATASNQKESQLTIMLIYCYVQTNEMLNDKLLAFWLRVSPPLPISFNLRLKHK